MPPCPKCRSAESVRPNIGDRGTHYCPACNLWFGCDSCTDEQKCAQHYTSHLKQTIASLREQIAAHEAADKWRGPEMMRLIRENEYYRRIDGGLRQQIAALTKRNEFSGSLCAAFESEARKSLTELKQAREQIAALEAERAGLRAVVDLASELDHREDSHRYSTPCLRCEADTVRLARLSAPEPTTEEVGSWPGP
jgi:hypothetical protein